MIPTKSHFIQKTSLMNNLMSHLTSQFVEPYDPTQMRRRMANPATNLSQAAYKGVSKTHWSSYNSKL